MAKKKVILLSAAIAISAGAFYIYKEYNRTNQHLGDVKADVSISATSLIKKFEDDENAANKEFIKKKDFIVAVSGLVKDVTQDEKGFFTVSVGDTAAMSSVRCAVDSIYGKEAGTLKKGEPIVMQGAITGFNKDELVGSDVILNRCAVIRTNN